MPRATDNLSSGQYEQMYQVAAPIPAQVKDYAETQAQNWIQAQAQAQSQVQARAQALSEPPAPTSFAPLEVGLMQKDVHKSLCVLFSHSSRIRCFMQMLFPINGYNSESNKSKSIYELLKDYKKKVYSKRNIIYSVKDTHGVKYDDLKFNNCVVFHLFERGGKYYLSMKDPGEGNRIKYPSFSDIIGIEDCDKDTEIEIQKIEQSPRYSQDNIQLTDLLNVSDLLIIRHGQGTHNRNSLHLHYDSSLTKKGLNESVNVAKRIINFFTEYNNIRFYVSELFRTQQTAMVFINVALNESEGRDNPFYSSNDYPIPLIVLPCSHEFNEKYLDKGGCYDNQDEREVRSGKNYKLENVPEFRPEWTSKRIYVTYKYAENKKESYFHIDTRLYSSSKDCKKTVFHYMFDSLTNYVRIFNSNVVYTEMDVAAGYDFVKDEYVKERKNFFGGSLKKNKKKKRKTLRRKSKRFTKKRNSRRTNKKKRLTNKRRTNKKKRFTKRR